MKHLVRAHVFLLFCVLLWEWKLPAQTMNKERPRVGLALSGGSALGLAHVGVIRYFEEHRIPIDYVAGTSIGGLIGGFYATGMDSVQLTTLIEHADWDALLSANPRFIDQPVEDKQRWNRTFGNLTLRFGRRFSLPAGLNPGENLALLLSRATLPYSDITDFDQLPTPFRCVATDLVSGNKVVIGKGSLAQAMRATMSIPGIFTPVKRDGMVLVDGGLVENIPVDAVRNMGAQTVIAVSLEIAQSKPDQIKSLPDVLRQTVAVAVLQNERRSLASANLVIDVDTRKFYGTDYSQWREIIKAGYEAAQKMAPELARFELSPEEWKSYVEARNRRILPSRNKGAVVAVVSSDPKFQHNAEFEIRRKLGHGVVSEHRLEETLTGMVAATAVPGASYEWQQEPDKNRGYKVTFPQRPSDQVLARIGFQYGISPGEPSRAGLKFSTTTIFQDAYKERLTGVINIGYDPGARGEYYRPFGGSEYFIAPGLFVERYHLNSYTGPVRRSETRDRFGGSFYGGIGTWRFAQLRIGAQAGYDSYSHSATVDGVKADSQGFAAPELQWIYNNQDSGGLPTRGTRSEGSFGYSFRDHSYPYLRQNFSTVQPVNSKISFFGDSQSGTSFGRKLNYYEQFAGGGQFQLSAFRYQEFHANTLVEGGGGMIIHGPAIRWLSIYPGMAIWYEAGRFDMGSRGWQTHQSTSTGLFFPTPLGAAGFSLSFDEAGKARFRLMLGSF